MGYKQTGANAKQEYGTGDELEKSKWDQNIMNRKYMIDKTKTENNET